MTRDDAIALLQPYIQAVTFRGSAPCKCVRKIDAAKLLGDEVYGRLQKDKIRFLGPGIDMLYYWNVVDYLHQPDLGKPKQ